MQRVLSRDGTVDHTVYPTTPSIHRGEGTPSNPSIPPLIREILYGHCVVVESSVFKVTASRVGHIVVPPRRPRHMGAESPRRQRPWGLDVAQNAVVQELCFSVSTPLHVRDVSGPVVTRGQPEIRETVDAGSNKRVFSITQSVAKNDYTVHVRGDIIGEYLPALGGY